MKPRQRQTMTQLSTTIATAARPPTLLLAGILLASTSLPAIAASAPPSNAELANASYNGINDQTITLSDGQWQGAPFVAGGASRPAAGLVEHFRLTGDLDGDGQDEAVALLWSSGGGTGTFSHIAVMKRTDADAISNLGTALIGDRVQIRAARIQDQRIVLDLVQSGPNDGACCPTELTTRSWTLKQGLQEQAANITGSLSTVAIGGSGGKQVWQLTEFAADAPVVDDVTITLQLNGDKLVGSSGCNRYFAGLKDGESPGTMIVGPVGGTMMACPGEVSAIERRFLRALEGSTHFSFFAGDLILSGGTDSEPSTLRFVPQAVGE